MKRTLAFVVAAMLVAGAASAQCAMRGATPAAADEAPVSPCMRGMQQGMMMRQGPMAAMAGAPDTAVWRDNVYVLQGNVLEKRDTDDNTIKSVTLEDMETCEDCCGAAAGTPCSTCPGMGTGMGGGEHRQGMMQGHGMMQGQGGMRQGHGMMGGRQNMQRGNMMSCVRVQADENGVYLLRHGMFATFDHDLNKVKSWQAMCGECMNRDNVRQCAMRHMQRSQRPNCRMMMGAMQEERTIDDGYVRMWHRPATITPGATRFQVQVNTLSGMGDDDAVVTAYLYPRDDVSAGVGVPMQSVGGGAFYGIADIPAAGMWELSLRIKRPGVDDVKVYYVLPVQ